MSTERFPEPEDDILAAEYVLGVTSVDERRAFEARLSAEPGLRQLVKLWNERLLPLGDAVSPEPPPPQLLNRIEATLFGIANTKATWLQSLQFWRGLSMASLLAAAVAITLYVGAIRTDQPLTQSAVAEVSGPQKAVTLVVLYDGAKGELKFNRVSGAPSDGRDFQLWLIAGKQAPVSLGVLPTEASGTIRLNDELKAQIKGSVLAISDEPKGGSPTGQPTGAVLATGSLASI